MENNCPGRSVILRSGQEDYFSCLSLKISVSRSSEKSQRSHGDCPGEPGWRITCFEGGATLEASQHFLGSIARRCSGNDPALLPRTSLLQKNKTELEPNTNIKIKDNELMTPTWSLSVSVSLILLCSRDSFSSYWVFNVWIFFWLISSSSMSFSLMDISVDKSAKSPDKSKTKFIKKLYLEFQNTGNGKHELLQFH